MAEVPFLPDALDPVLLASLTQEQLAALGLGQQQIVSQGLETINSPAFDPTSGPFTDALRAFAAGRQPPEPGPPTFRRVGPENREAAFLDTPSNISDAVFGPNTPQARDFLFNDPSSRTPLEAFGTDVLGGLLSVGSFGADIGGAVADLPGFLTRPLGESRGTPAGDLFGVEAAPVTDALAGQKSTQQLAADFFASRGGGALGAGVDLGRLPDFPTPPQRGTVAPTNFTAFEEALSALAPDPLGKGEEKGIINTARFAGMADALQGLGQFSSVGDILLAAGTGLLSGRAKGRAQVRAEERAYEAKLFEFNKLRADGELAKAEVVRAEAEQVADVAYQNKLIEFEAETRDMMRREPKMLGVSPGALGGGTIWQITDDNGQRQIVRESPSALLSAFGTSSALMGQSGAGRKGQFIATPRIPNSILGSTIAMLRQLNVSQLEPLFGEDLLQESLSFGLESAQNMIATGNNEAAGIISTDAQFGVLAQAILQDETLFRNLLIALGADPNVTTQ